MAFQVSPGVLVQERDLTNIIPAVSTSIGAVAGQFAKGPLDEIVSIGMVSIQSIFQKSIQSNQSTRVSTTEGSHCRNFVINVQRIQCTFTY